MMLTTTYFGIGMENVDVLPWIGVQWLVLHFEMECKNTFLHSDLGIHYLPFKKIEANLHIKYTDLFSSILMHITLTIIYTYVTTQNNM